VATAVVHAAETADVAALALFDDGKRIHVGAQPDTARPVAAAKHADDAGTADALMDFKAQFAQCGSDDGRGTVLGEREFRMRMQVAPKLDQGWQQVGYFGDRGYR